MCIAMLIARWEGGPRAMYILWSTDPDRNTDTVSIMYAQNFNVWSHKILLVPYPNMQCVCVVCCSLPLTMHIFYICTQYVTAQAISGTGALRLAGMFLVSHSTPLELQQILAQQNLLLLPCLAPQQKFYPYSKTIYLTNPSWPNHAPVFRQVTNTLHVYDLLIDS